MTPRRARVSQKLWQIDLSSFNRDVECPSVAMIFAHPFNHLRSNEFSLDNLIGQTAGPPTFTILNGDDRLPTAPRLGARLPSSAAAIRPPIASDALRRGSASRCAYRCVVDACVCPNSLPIIGRPSPPPAPKLA